MDERHMQHGRDWSGGNPRGQLASEKYRGARAYWDGFTLWSRGGRAIRLPDAWLAELPVGFALDGEVWAGRGPAHGLLEVEAGQAVTHSRFTARLQFLVFDAPSAPGDWPRRMAAAARRLQGCAIVRPVGFVPVESRRHLESLWAAIARKGGEGLMLRDPAAGPYAPGRSRAVLKLKHDPAGVRGVVRCFTSVVPGPSSLVPCPRVGFDSRPREYGQPALNAPARRLRRPLRLPVAV